MDWLAYFLRNRARRPPLRPGTIQVDPALRGRLVRSLQRFQVGEQGDGCYLRHAARAAGDARYAATVDLFIAEEQGHARLLAGLLRALGAPVLRRHWSDQCFIWLRHRGGLYGELLVLMAAELIGAYVYELIHGATADPRLRATMAHILADEAGHVAFHCDALRRGPGSLPPLARYGVRLGWRLLYRGACLVVLLDQWPLLRAVGVGPLPYWRATGERFDAAEQRVFSPGAPVIPLLAGRFAQPAGAHNAVPTDARQRTRRAG